MSTATSYIEILLTEVNGTRQILLQGFYVKVNEISLSTKLPNAAWKAAPALFQFKLAENTKLADILAWAAANKFTATQLSKSMQGPTVVSLALDSTKKILTITFNENINVVVDAATLKAAITKSSDGVTYAALGGSDSISTPNGSSNTLTITLNAAMTGATNAFKIAIGALKNSIALTSPAITLSPIDVAVPTVTFLPANSATGVLTNSLIVVTFSKAVTKLNGAVILPSDVLSLITLKLTNSSGAAVPFTATISGNQLVIKPINLLLNAQVYYVAIAASAVSDLSGNPNAAATATFTTAS